MLPQKHSPSNHDESIRDRMTQRRIFKEKKKKRGGDKGGGGRGALASPFCANLGLQDQIRILNPKNA